MLGTMSFAASAWTAASTLERPAYVGSPRVPCDAMHTGALHD